ncbi:hypothetical protein BJ165DRAFT_1401341 [Panaeolus papilionaceus]|nr:hypothetical protein BJ165DRAFT_1401341 [Panaeolus papilionaceus]
MASNFWNTSHNEHNESAGMDTVYPFAEYISTVAQIDWDMELFGLFPSVLPSQNLQDDMVGINNLDQPFPVPPYDIFPTIDGTAQTTPHGFDSLANGDNIWGFSSLMNRPPGHGGQPLVLPSHSSYSVGVPQFQQVLDQVSSAQGDIVFPSAQPYGRSLGEPDFNQGLVAEPPERQGTQNPANQIFSPPRHQRIKVSEQIIHMMSVARVHPNHDMGKDARVSQAEDTLAKHIARLPPDDRSWIESKRESVGTSLVDKNSISRRGEGARRKGLYLCLWCKKTFTTKHNLARLLSGSSSKGALKSSGYLFSTLLDIWYRT